MLRVLSGASLYRLPIERLHPRFTQRQTGKEGPQPHTLTACALQLGVGVCQTHLCSNPQVP